MAGRFVTGLALFGAFANAFPRVVLDQLADPVEGPELRRALSGSPPQGSGALPLAPPPFDASAQYVSNTGAHAFQAPGAGDQRGMCPGLNAMANHGYLPHNGVGTITDFATACQTVFGMGADLATVLAVYGAVVDGTLLSWSIGGTPHLGIGGSHNNYETDSSPIYADLNQFGSNEEFVMNQFKELYDLQPDAATANYNLEVLRDFRKTRFQESIDKNPYFLYGVFSGMAVSQAAFTFVYRFMSNKSAEYPEGVLNKDVLKSFYSVTGPDNNLKHTPGHERIPDNWYKRNTLDAYTVPYFVADILYFTETIPAINLPGCNLGKTDSYLGLGPEVLSNGAYTQADVAKNPLCFAMEYAIASLPGLTQLTSILLAPLLSQLTSVTSSLNCAPITSVNTTAFSVCPGFSLFGGPTGPVAPGAIQS